MALQDKAKGEFEICVGGCGKVTNVRKDTPIEKRGGYYVQGVGQVCQECYTEIYGPLSGEKAQIMIQLNDIGILV